MSQFIFETAPKIICEQGGANRLGEIAKGLGISRAFLVTDAGLVKARLLDGALASLTASGVQATVFSEVLADPPELSVKAMKVQRLLVNNPRDGAYEDALAMYQAAY